MMSLLIFFARLERYRHDHLSSTLPRRAHVSSRDCDKTKGPRDLYDPAEVNDVSYDDAILDLGIRHFMQAEYGQAEPPKGVLQRVLLAIRWNTQASRAAQSGPAGAFRARIYGMINGPVTRRLLPGAMAFGMLFLVLVSNNGRLLQGGAGYMLTSVPLSVPTAVVPLLVNQPTGETLNDLSAIPGLQLPIKDETQFYDRIELRLPPKRQDDRPGTGTNQQEDMLFDRTGSGAQ